MSEIFLSYAKEDRDRAKILAEALDDLGWSVWWDRVIPTGRVFDEVIEEEIDAAGCVIVLWSEHSVDSRWVKAEAESAVEQAKLFPVRIDRVEIPFAFKQFQAADLVDWDGRTGSDDFSLLVSDLGRLLGSPPPPVARESRHEAAPRVDLSASHGRARWLGGVLIVGLALFLSFVWPRPFGPAPARKTPKAESPTFNERGSGRPVVAPRHEPGPELELLRVSIPEVRGGDPLTGQIHLNGPAIEECDVRLVVHDEDYRSEHGLPDGVAIVVAPDFVRIPPGAREAEFSIETAEVVAEAMVVIEARLGESAAETRLWLVPGPGEPAGESSLSLQFLGPGGPQDHFDLTSGTTVQTIVYVSEPAPEDRRIELLVHPEPELLMFPEFVLLHRGAREVQFAVEARRVDRAVDLVLEAHLPGAHASALLNLVP